MRFVPTKTPEQQSGLMLHRTRHLFIRQQTSVINAQQMTTTRQFSDFEISELLTGEPPLLPEGFYDDNEPGELCAEKRDTRAMRLAWEQNEAALLEMWRSGWRPESKFAGWKEPRGARPALPPGWFKFLRRAH
jgi:transposase